MAGTQGDQRNARLAAAGGAGERQARPRQGGLRAVGVAASRVAAPIIARRGGVLARLKARWAEAAGSDVAAVAWPEALGRDGALKLRVVPGAGLELQHRAPLLIERINQFFGHQAVARLVLVQGPLPLGAMPRTGAPLLSAADERSLDAALADIGDPELRRALAGLGRLITAAGRG